MNVQGIGNPFIETVPRMKQEQTGDPAFTLQPIEEQVQTGVGSTTTAQAQSTGEGQRGQGVVNLLQEDHFNGVADMRLRINFHAELQISTTQGAGEELETRSQELTADLDFRVGKIGEEFGFSDQVDDVMSPFEETVNGFFNGNGGGGWFEPAAVFEGMRDAFANIFSMMQSFEPTALEDVAESEDVVDAVAPGGAAVEDQVAGGDVAVTDTDAVNEMVNGVTSDDGIAVEDLNANDDVAPVLGTSPVAASDTSIEEVNGTAAEATDFSMALQDLRSWFEEAIAALEKSVYDSWNMPSSSGARGNGMAYDRFMDTYNEMNSLFGDNNQKSTGLTTSLNTAA